MTNNTGIKKNVKITNKKNLADTSIIFIKANLAISTVQGYKSDIFLLLFRKSTFLPEIPK